jgi:hypothetical protein
LKKRIFLHLPMVKNRKRDLSKNLEPFPTISIFLLKGTILSSAFSLEKGDLLQGTKEKGTPAIETRVGRKESFLFSLPASLLQGPLLLVSISPPDRSFYVGKDPLFEKKDSDRGLLFFEGIRVIEKNFLEKPLLLGGLFERRFFDTGDLFRLFALSPTYPFLRRNLVIQIESSLSHCKNWLARPSFSLQNGIQGYLPQFMRVLSLFRDEKKKFA